MQTMSIQALHTIFGIATLAGPAKRQTGASTAINLLMVASRRSSSPSEMLIEVKRPGNSIVLRSHSELRPKQVALPDDVVAAVAEGRAVLFLGSGASRGAKNGSGEKFR